MNKKLIILIDDDKDFALAISSLLSIHGYKTRISFDAEDGLRLLKESRPDMIILDPGMKKGFSGFKLYRIIRSDASLERVPVVVLTRIETYVISSRIIGMYREMRDKDDFKNRRVLRIVDSTNKTIGIEYYDDEGEIDCIEPELFLPKTNSGNEIIREITKLVDHETGI